MTWRARIARLKTWVPLLSTALLFNLAFPPINFGLLALVALAPWLAWLRDASPKQAWRSGFALGALIYGVQMIWLLPLVTKWTGSAALSLVPWVLAAAIGGFFYLWVGLAGRWCMAQRKEWLFPFLYAGMEVIRASLPGLAFPYALISTPLWPYPVLTQNAFLGTQYLVSAWVVAVSVLGAMLLLNEKWHRGRALMLGAGLFVALSATLMGRELPGKPRTLVAGQLGADIAFGDMNERTRAVNAVEAIVEAAKYNQADLVVLPEGLVDGGGRLPPTTPFRLPEGVSVVFGGRRGSGPVYQSAFARSASGEWSFADKSRLVVFGEYVPGRDWLPFLDQFKLPTGDLVAADKVSALQVGDLKVGPLLCFEAMFWDVAHAQTQNGAQVLAVMCLDDWYFGTPAPDQLRAAAVWRAVETGLPVVRSAPLGYTMIVDGKGEVVTEAPTRLQTPIKASVAVPDAPAKNPFRPVFPWAAGLLWPAWGVYLLGARMRQNRA